MSEKLESLAARLRDTFSGSECVLANNEVTLTVTPAALLRTCTSLRDDFGFDILIDVAGVDYLEYAVAEWSTDEASSEGFSRGVDKSTFGRFSFEDAPERRDYEGSRFAAVYHLLSIDNNVRLRVKVFCEDDNLPVLPSVIGVWSCANWYEREAFDLYGIVFEGHPDLRRLLTDYGFIGHPFRKDFPLIGNVEMRYDPEQGRVVYQPVTIEPRVLVPKVIRSDHRYVEDAPENEQEDAAGDA